MRYRWLHTIWIVVAACRGVPPAQDSPPEEVEGEEGTTYIDIDNDGHNSTVDCDDSNRNVHPNAKEICDGIDQDCDSMVDEGFDEQTWFEDSDGDLYGNSGSTKDFCGPSAVEEPYVRKSGDCDDEVAWRHPGAEELCNGSDDDCDGELDEGLVGEVVSYRDADGDRYGDPGSTVLTCAPAEDGYVEGAGDCDDADDAVNPSASEVCNGVDDDCDGDVDGPDALDATLWYTDVDGDGYGDPALTELACDAPAGSAAVAGDCDDGDGAAWPGASERCDGDDDDCDGEADESDAVDPSIWTRDADGDGYGAIGGANATACDEPYGYAASADDCDDTDVAVNPGAVELPNTGDDDCDGVADDGATFPSDPVTTIAPTCLSDEGACGDGTAANGLDEDCDGDPDDDCDEDGDGDGQTPNDGDCDDDDGAVIISHKVGFGDPESWLSDPDIDSSNTLILFGDVNGDGMQDTLLITTGGVVYAALATNTDAAGAGDLQADAFVPDTNMWWPPAGSGTVFTTIRQYYAYVPADTADPPVECDSASLLTPWLTYSFINSDTSGVTKIELTATYTQLADVDGDADDDLVLYVGDLDGTDPGCGNGCANGCNTASGPYASSCSGFEGGWYVFRSNGRSFDSPTMWLDGAVDDDGYAMDEIYIADVTGDGAADLVTYSNDADDAMGCPDGCYPDENSDGKLTDETCGSTEVGWWAVAASEDSDGDIYKTKDSFASFTSYKTGFGCTFTGASTCEVDWRGVADVNKDGLADLVAADFDTDKWQVSLSSGSSFAAATTWRSTGGTVSAALTLFDMDAGGSVWIEDDDGDGDLDSSAEVQTGVRLADVDGDLDADLVVIGSYDLSEGVHKWRVALAEPDTSGSGTFTGDLSASSDDDVWLKTNTSVLVSRFSVRNVSESDDDEAGGETLADAIIYASGTWYVAQATGVECSDKESL